MDYSKWTNFTWAGEKTGGEERSFHPYTKEDLNKGATVGGKKNVIRWKPGVEGAGDQANQVAQSPLGRKI